MSYKLVGIGEVLWDLFPNGPKLGGAPGNFAYHACSLHAQGYIISRIGQDSEGAEILNRFKELGIPVDFIELDPTKPTGTVLVEDIAGNQHRFTIREDVAWDRITGSSNAEKLMAEADAICFGTLAQRNPVSRATILKLASSARESALRILDVNLRQDFYSRDLIEQSLRHVNALKVNDAELPLLAEMFGIHGEMRGQMAGLATRFQLKTVACTRGAQGSLIYSDEAWSDHPGIAAQLVDSVGAGDSFTAAMAIGLLAKWPLDKVNLHANQVASYVASCAGATPIMPEALRNPFKLVV
ncbi:MAG: carbohydrate kinase family protein [Verrucomicrobiales bacterium]